MDRMKAREIRKGTRYRTRLKYTTRPNALNSPTTPTFIVERRLPNNYKTIKTSSRSTVATSSSLSTLNIEESEKTGRYSTEGDGVNDSPKSPIQAFRTNRTDDDTTRFDNKNTEENDNHFSKVVTNGLSNLRHDEEDKGAIMFDKQPKEDLSKLRKGEKDKKHDVKAPGYDVDPSTNLVDDIKPKKLNSDTTNSNIGRNLHELNEDLDRYEISLLNGDNLERKEEQSKTKKITSPSLDTDREWQPVISKPKTSAAPHHKDKCLNECGSCRSSDKKLKLLPCLHSFCMKCLESQVFETYRKMIRCTVCGCKFPVPSTGLDSLENNYYFHFSELSVSENERCDVCSSKAPSSQCTECQLNLCSDCVKEHLSNSETSHYVVNVAIEMIGRTPWSAICSKHNPFTLELYCINCSQLICGRCALDNHNNHVTENAEMYARDKRQELETKLADSHTSKFVSNIDKHIKLLKKERENVQKGIINTISAIRSHVDTLKKRLDEFCDKVVEDVTAKGDVFCKGYDRKIETSQQKRKAKYISIETLKQIVHRTRDIDLITKYYNLMDVLSELSLENNQDIVPHLDITYIPFLDSLTKSVGRVNVIAKLKKPLMFTEEASVQFPRHVVTVFPVDNARAWVGFRKHIQQCTIDGTIGLRISVGDYVVAIDKSIADTLYIACRSCVQVLTAKLQLKQLFHLSHEPSDMKFNHEDHVIISFRDARRVALFSNHGTPIKEFDIRHFGYRFGVRMNDPWKLAITDSRDIFLTDYTSEHIAVFDELCEMKGTFRSNVYKQASLGYKGGLVYIIDYKRDSLNVFSEDGHFLQSHQLEGLKAPSCIAVLSGCLWIGSWNGLVKCYHIKYSLVK